MPRTESAARQQHHAGLVGQLEQQFVGLDRAHHPFDEFRPDRLAAELLDIEQRVVVDCVRVIALRCNADLPVQRGLAAADQPLHRVLVVVRRIHQREQREQHHLHLLRRRQASRVVQRHGAAVRDQAVDELELLRLGGDRAVALVQLLALRLRQLADLQVEDVIAVRGDHAQAPAGRAEILGERIHQDGVPRTHREQRDKVVGKGAVDIVGQDDQVRALFDDRGQVFQALVAHAHRGRVARVDQEEGLDLGVAQLVQFLVRVLPARFGIGVDGQLHQLVVVQLRDLDIRREDRHAQRDGVAGLEQVVLADGVEQVCHRRGAALDREQVELADERMAADHLLADVLADDDLGQLQHAVRHRIVAGEDAFAHLVEEITGVQAELVAHV
ncbi:hypothetical protein D9M68_441710 [compost metagenome]